MPSIISEQVLMPGERQSSLVQYTKGSFIGVGKLAISKRELIIKEILTISNLKMFCRIDLSERNCPQGKDDKFGKVRPEKSVF